MIDQNILNAYETDPMDKSIFYGPPPKIKIRNYISKTKNKKAFKRKNKMIKRSRQKNR